MGLGLAAGGCLAFRVAFDNLSFSLIFGSLVSFVGVGRAAYAVVSFVQVVGPRLALVVSLRASRLFWSFWFRIVCPLVRRLMLVNPVGIWPKSAQVAS